MPVTEYERNHLFTWFEEHMGKERAATMMSLLPPVGWGDVATKRDLDALEERLDGKIDRVAERLDGKIDRLDGKIDHGAERLDGKIDRLDGKVDRVAERLAAKIDGATATTRADLAELRTDLADLRSDLQRTFVTWMFATQGAVIAAIGMLFALVR